MPAPPYLAMESCIASAHRALARAQALAEQQGLQGLSDDLFAYLLELERLQVSLLRGARGVRSSLPSQQRMSTTMRNHQ